MSFTEKSETETIHALGEDEAVNVASALVRKSKWFICTPMPHEVYEFKIKDE